MKLEAAAGIRHLCTKDTPSLNISFPYAEADTGRTRSSLLPLSVPLYAPDLSGWFCASKVGGKEKCIWGRGPLGLDLSGSTWCSWQRQRGESPHAWWVGWATHTAPTCNERYHTSHTHLLCDPMNCIQNIIYNMFKWAFKTNWLVALQNKCYSRITYFSDKCMKERNVT